MMMIIIMISGYFHDFLIVLPTLRGPMHTESGTIRAWHVIFHFMRA